MKELLNSMTLPEWMLFGAILITLLISLLALYRASHALRLAKTAPAIPVAVEVEPLSAESERPEVVLDISAERDEKDQVTLLLRNNGSLSVRQLKLTIEPPERIFSTEGLSQGMERADISNNTVILPRLAVLGAENVFPVDEILPDNQIVLPAVLTMAHGKICDFPVTGKWSDGKGRSQQQKYRITI